ncbi:MAG TPA: MOSC domain-containing protein [Clostridia bacterium]|nr:MOSC domain-containing protein [Clostridia bacterium]
MGKVIAVNISEKKGVVKHPVVIAECVEDYGIKGDAHGGKGIRQVSLLGIESIDKFRKQKNAVGLCEGKFAENITTEGLILYQLPVGTRLRIGESVHEVSQIGKKCHADQGCEVAKLYGQCIMPKEGIFTIVIRGGIIKAGDSIEII